MKTIVSAAVAAIALAVSAIAVPGQALAQEPAAGSAAISATGHPANRHGWLTTFGPDAQGRFAVSINIADLDASTTAGKAKIAARIDRGAAELCDMTADGPQIAGFYDGGARQCRAETRAAAMARLGNGGQVSMRASVTARASR